MNYRKLQAIAAVCVISLAGCRTKETPKASETPAAAAQPAATPGGAAPAGAKGAATLVAGAPVAAPASTPVAGAPAPATTPAAPPPPPPPPPPPLSPKQWTIPAGTTIAVRTLDGMSTKNARAGNEFDATLNAPLVVDGATLANTGSSVVGKVVSSDEGGRVKGKAMMTLALVRVSLRDGQTINVQTSSVSQEAKSDTKKNMVRTGIMAGAGAAIGAIAGGGKGAAIGAGIGGGAGVATDVATRGPAALVPAEALLTFRTQVPVTVTEKKR